MFCYRCCSYYNYIIANTSDCSENFFFFDIAQELFFLQNGKSLGQSMTQFWYLY